MENETPHNNTIPDHDLKLALADHLLEDLLRERRSERRWRRAKRIFYAVAGIVLFAVYMAFYLGNLGYKLLPGTDVVAVVRLSGPIGAGEPASGEKIVPALEKAFKAKHVKAIALQIDSPGGSPYESERIGDSLDRLRNETHKPVYSFIENTGASAAYLVALHTDRIVSGRYSLVGSVGAVIAAWDFHKLLQKLDVDQRVFASGIHKNMLNPYKPMSPESEAKAQEMVNRMAGNFAAEFKRLREGKLVDGVDYFTGEVWGGEDALKLGLVDEVGTMDNVVKQAWKLPTRDFGPQDPSKAMFPFASEFLGGLLRNLATQTRLGEAIPRIPL